MDKVLLVFVGGGIGSILRYLIAKAGAFYEAFPYGTLIANALSCIILGMAVAWITLKNPGERLGLFLITGLCGGFSTYSTFTNETLQLFRKGDHMLALINIFGTLLLCVACILIGMKVIHLLFPR